MTVPPIATRLREGLLEAADVGQAAEVATNWINVLNDLLNEHSDETHPQPLTFAESLVARALIARGLLMVAADWWADAARSGGKAAPTPEYHEALRSLVDDPPPEINDFIIDTRTGAES